MVSTVHVNGRGDRLAALLGAPVSRFRVHAGLASILAHRYALDPCADGALLQRAPPQTRAQPRAAGLSFAHFHPTLDPSFRDPHTHELKIERVLETTMGNEPAWSRPRVQTASPHEHRQVKNRADSPIQAPQNVQGRDF